jgi:2-methylcitrate dehydratase PrpD
MGTLITRELAAGVNSLRLDDMRDGDRDVGRQCLLDWFGVTLAGATEPGVAMLTADAEDQGGHAQSTLVGQGRRVAARQAALINGTASHAHDYDDVNLAMNGHATVAVAGGVIALAERLDVSGEDLLEAFIAGYETTCQVGQLVLPSHYENGFHATATTGVFGAAAACGRLLKLNDDEMTRAFGIAGTMAAGLKANFGTDCKPFHAGRATEAGMLAAGLASRGFSSATDILEHGQGFAAALSDDFHPEAMFAAPDRGGLHIRNNLFKYHAACYNTHAAIECGKQLLESGQVTADQVAQGTIRVHRSCDKICNQPSPDTGLGIKFSLRMTTALALAGIETAGLDAYSDAVANDPALMAVRDRFSVELVDDVTMTWTELQIEGQDGQRFATEHDSGIPTDNVAEQGARIERKFRALANPVIGDNRAGALCAAVMNIEEQPSIAELMQLAA